MNFGDFLFFEEISITNSEFSLSFLNFIFFPEMFEASWILLTKVLQKI